MALATIDICNMALDYCNIRNITSIDENTKEAKKCKMWYDIARKGLLMNINASFSIKRAVLAEYTDYIPVYGYGKAYALPGDLLQVLNLGNPIDDNLYQIEGEYFYCDEKIEQVFIRYIADITDTTKFDSEFCDLLALKLAEKICPALTEDEQKTQFIKQLATQKYIETSAKYGRDNRMIVINKPRFRQSKVMQGIQNFNYPVR
ncbi:MAG: hypothetical protein LUB59_04680 [Candidatus Gastranaerophilales bacterium]|nr:hypothetical protein [Candidatus Gastranaerophilales bacterium]